MFSRGLCVVLIIGGMDKGHAWFAVRKQAEPWKSSAEDVGAVEKNDLEVRNRRFKDGKKCGLLHVETAVCH